MNDILKKIDDYIESQKKHIINDWSSLVKIPSVGAGKEGSYPFGKNVDNMLGAVVELFRKNGFLMNKNSASGYALHHHKKEGKKTIGIFAHADVVPVNEAEWTLTKPFEPLIKNGYLIGRGVRDNKDGIIMALYALKAFKHIGIETNNSITVYVGGNEESGMKDIQAFVRDEEMPDLSLVPDNTYPFCKGEWGLIRLLCKSNIPLKSISDFHGGEAYNIVLDSVHVTAKYDHDIKEVLDESGIESTIKNDNISFCTKGIAGHAANPEGTVNAAYLAAKALLSTKSLDEQDRYMIQCIFDVLAEPYGEGLGISASNEDGKLTAVNGFVKLYDGHLGFSLDIRYAPELDGNIIVDKIKTRVAEYGFEVEVEELVPGFLLQEREAITNAFLSTIAYFGGETGQKPFVSKAKTYATYLKNAYSFGTSLYWEPELIGLPPSNGRAHQANEAASIQGLLQGIKIMTAILYQADSLL